MENAICHLQLQPVNRHTETRITSSTCKTGQGRDSKTSQTKDKHTTTSQSHPHHTYTYPSKQRLRRRRQNRIINMQLKRSEAQSASSTPNPAHMTVSIPRKGNPEGWIPCRNRKSNQGRLVEENATKRQDPTVPKNPALLTLPRCVVVVILQYGTRRRVSSQHRVFRRAVAVRTIQYSV
jgi:hypothetical protein